MAKHGPESIASLVVRFILCLFNLIIFYLDKYCANKEVKF